MLIGLLGKNAILIVEMANQYRKQGMSIFDAAVRGSVSRLRPILMTSFAFICGLIPLVMASGAGAWQPFHRNSCRRRYVYRYIRRNLPCTWTLPYFRELVCTS